MFKWFPYALLLLGASLVQAQWTQASGNPQIQGPYPESQYPQQSPYSQNPYPQGQYAENAQQTPDQGQPASDAPDPADLQHGVVRVSLAQGDVNVRRGDNGQLTGAVINTPLVTRDHLETSSGSRAEVELDAATVVRLAPNTDLGFADVQYHRVQVQLGLGTTIFRVLQNSPTQVEIDTPSVGIRALIPGEYRISVFDNGTSQITVREGQLEILAPRGSEQLASGRSIMVRGDASDPEMQDVAALAPDQFDEWSQQRDREFTPTQSYQYVNADMQGAADLDRYGSWVPSGYGQAWRPQGVAADWSPYSDGQWSYVDYYGWSWIDYSPWGWAPYHYGRWFWNTGYGWCWWPGARLHAAYWSPALVGFFGYGARGLGWVALAPFEMFHPWWGRFGFGFGHGGYGLAGYRNAAFRGGALIASYNTFAGIHQRFAMANRNQIIGARTVSGRLPIAVTRTSYSYSSRQAVPNSRFAAVQSRPFFHQNGQSRSFAASSSSSGIRNYSPSNAGWQHFGSLGSAPRQSFQNHESGGWHSFGNPQPGSNGFQSTPRYNQPSAARSYSQPNYQQQRSYQYAAPRQSNSAPRQSYSAPRQAQPHYSAPASPHGSGGGSHGGGSGHHGR
jgi:hypothetical protein